MVAATAGSRDHGRMRELLVLLRPIKEADLEGLGRLDTDPEASVPFLWYGFPNPHARRDPGRPGLSAPRAQHRSST